jgi:hypothetical protein
MPSIKPVQAKKSRPTHKTQPVSAEKKSHALTAEVLQKRLYEHEGKLLKIQIRAVRLDETYLTFELADERIISAPLAWYPFLRDASIARRTHFEILPGGWTVYWPDMDEYLDSRTLLKGKYF